MMLCQGLFDIIVALILGSIYVYFDFINISNFPPPLMRVCPPNSPIRSAVVYPPLPPRCAPHLMLQNFIEQVPFAFPTSPAIRMLHSPRDSICLRPERSEVGNK